MTAQAQEMETPGTTPISIVEEAYLAHRRGNYAEAIEGYSSIIQRRGLTKRERAITYLLRGEAKRDLGQQEEAISDFTRAITQWPGYPQAHFFRARIYEGQGKLNEAYVDFLQAVELDPNKESYQTHLSLLKKRMGILGRDVNPAKQLPNGD